jgi:hypothetical protein
MNDGSRNFGALPQNELWYAVRDHVQNPPSAKLTGFLCDNITEAWIDFSFHVTNSPSMINSVNTCSL